MTDSAGAPLADGSRDSASRTGHTISSEGLTLAVWDGPHNGPPVIFVHGYPDSHVVWDPVIDRLADRLHCIAYDVRGAGSSDAPASRADYSTSHLVTDLVAVLDGFAPRRPVHVVGHDWGSVQAWDAVLSEPTDERLSGRIASFTSISGPCVDFVRVFASTAWHGSWHSRRKALEQAARSWYVYAFQIPVLPELVLRPLSSRLVAETSGGRGRAGRFAPTLPRDIQNGINLYRANFPRRPRFPGGPPTALPVQLVVPLRDRYVLPTLAETAALFASDLTRVDLDVGHWPQSERPDDLARCIDTFITGAGMRA
jgi:pimeloyl-ACP methyl ester carboxylesterase